MAPRKQVRQMNSVRKMRRTMKLRALHTGSVMLPNVLSKNSKMGWQYNLHKRRTLGLGRKRMEAKTTERFRNGGPPLWERRHVAHASLTRMCTWGSMQEGYLCGAHNLDDGECPRQDDGPVGGCQGGEHDGADAVAKRPALEVGTHVSPMRSPVEALFW